MGEIVGAYRDTPVRSKGVGKGVSQYAHTPIQILIFC